MIVFTQPATSGTADIHSRVFDPVEKVPEDPVVRRFPSSSPPNRHSFLLRRLARRTACSRRTG